MIHELSHGIDVVSGFRSVWHKKYGAEASRNMSEAKAYQLEIEWGNSYINSNPIYLFRSFEES